jgi:hypothetical protein
VYSVPGNGTCGRFPHHPPAEIVTQTLNREGKQKRRQERVVRGGVCNGVAVGPVVGVAAADGAELLQSLVPFRMKVGLTLSVDTVTALPRMRSCSVFFFRDRTW